MKSFFFWFKKEKKNEAHSQSHRLLKVYDIVIHDEKS